MILQQDGSVWATGNADNAKSHGFRVQGLGFKASLANTNTNPTLILTGRLGTGSSSEKQSFVQVISSGVAAVGVRVKVRVKARVGVRVRVRVRATLTAMLPPSHQE